MVEGGLLPPGRSPGCEGGTDYHAKGRGVGLSM